jgi:hypothetical protein
VVHAYAIFGVTFSIRSEMGKMRGRQEKTQEKKESSHRAAASSGDRTKARLEGSDNDIEISCGAKTESDMGRLLTCRRWLLSTWPH